MSRKAIACLSGLLSILWCHALIAAEGDFTIRLTDKMGRPHKGVDIRYVVEGTHVEEPQITPVTVLDGKTRTDGNGVIVLPSPALPLERVKGAINNSKRVRVNLTPFGGRTPLAQVIVENVLGTEPLNISLVMMRVREVYTLELVRSVYKGSKGQAHLLGQTGTVFYDLYDGKHLVDIQMDKLDENFVYYREAETERVWAFARRPIAECNCIGRYSVWLKDNGRWWFYDWATKIETGHRRAVTATQVASAIIRH